MLYNTYNLYDRSGKYCYKPTMNMTCCPQYTIKCDTLKFKLSKSQKKVIKRVNKYLITGVKQGESHDADLDGNEGTSRASQGPSGDNFVQGKTSSLSLTNDDVKTDRTDANKDGKGTELAKTEASSI